LRFVALSFIIGRMINKWAALVLCLGFLACREEAPEGPVPFQGVIEYDERLLAFELGGRLAEVEVHRGETVKAKQVVARLDDEIDRTERQARAAEAEAAAAQVRLLKAGARPEELGALAAKVRAARAGEELVKQNLDRERTLAARGASTKAVLDDLEAQLKTAIANRQALEQELAAMKKGAREPEIESADARASAARGTVALQDERLDRRLLRAPIGGAVLDVHVDPGEVISAGTPVLTLGDTTRPYVDIFVPVGKLEGIKIGVPAEVRVDASNESFPAKVDWISPTTEFTPRYLFSDQERPNLVIRVRLLIDDKDKKLHAGVPAFATIDGAGR